MSFSVSYYCQHKLQELRNPILLCSDNEGHYFDIKKIAKKNEQLIQKEETRESSFKNTK